MFILWVAVINLSLRNLILMNEKLIDFQVARTGTCTKFMKTSKMIVYTQRCWTRTRQRAKASGSVKTGSEWFRSFLWDTNLLMDLYLLVTSWSWHSAFEVMCAQRQVIYTELYRVTWGLLRLEIQFKFYSILVMSEAQIPLAMFNRYVWLA